MSKIKHLLSYIVPVYFTTVIDGVLATPLPTTYRTVTRWKFHRGRIVGPVRSETLPLFEPHPNCRCSIKPIEETR